MDEENIGEKNKIKRKETGRGRQKRQNMESEAGVVWGAEVQKHMRRGTNFCMKDWLQGQREQVDKES